MTNTALDDFIYIHGNIRKERKHVTTNCVWNKLKNLPLTPSKSDIHNCICWHIILGGTLPIKAKIVLMYWSMNLLQLFDTVLGIILQIFSTVCLISSCVVAFFNSDSNLVITNSHSTQDGGSFTMSSKPVRRSFCLASFWSGNTTTSYFSASSMSTVRVRNIDFQLKVLKILSILTIFLFAPNT